MHTVALLCPARGHVPQWQSGCMFHGGLPPPPTVSGVEKETPPALQCDPEQDRPFQACCPGPVSKDCWGPGQGGQRCALFPGIPYANGQVLCVLIGSQVRRVELITLEFKSWQSPALIMLSFHLSSLALVSSLPTGADTNGLKCHASLENVCCHTVLLLIYTKPLCYESHSFSYFHSLMTILLGSCYAPGFDTFIRHLLWATHWPVCWASTICQALFYVGAEGGAVNQPEKTKCFPSQSLHSSRRWQTRNNEQNLKVESLWVKRSINLGWAAGPVCVAEPVYVSSEEPTGKFSGILRAGC